MAQTEPLVAQLFGIDEQALVRFREILSQTDQQALDAVLDSTQLAIQVTAEAGHAFPIELFFIAILMEQQKTLQFLLGRLNYYDQKLYGYRVGKSCQPGK